MSKTDLRRQDSESRRLMRYRKEYAGRRRRQAVSLIPVAALGAVTAMGGAALLGMSEQGFLALVGTVILGFFGFSLVNWRCPSCGAYFGQRLNPRECRACGTVLRE